MLNPNLAFTQFLSATRPRTYPIAIMSLGVSQSLAYRTLGGFTVNQWLIAFLVIYTALSLQILSNLANDYGDGVRGTDNHRHADSPTRLVGSGIVSLSKFRTWLIVWLTQTMMAGMVLIWLSVLSIQEILLFFGLGLLSILGAVGYTIGKKPYGYQALGELSVLVFFGFVAVFGGYYLQVGKADMLNLPIATGVGLLSACVLYINNLRDVDSDRASGKITLAIVLAEHRIMGYFVLLGTSMLCYIYHLVAFGKNAWGLVLVTPILVRHIYTVQKHRNDSIRLGKELGTIVLIFILTNILTIILI